MCKELLFVGFPLLGLLAGFHLGYRLDTAAALGDWPDWVFVLGGCVLGYFTGAGLVWLTRILGTLAFGKEAMGLGDVHLMAAIGAVLGPIDATLALLGREEVKARVGRCLEQVRSGPSSRAPQGSA